MSEQARAIDGANPSDVRDQTGAQVAQKRIAFSAVFNQEDAKAFADVHAMTGNDRRANELRTLIGEPVRGRFSSFLNRPRAFSLTELAIGAAVVAGTTYGWKKFRKYRANKKEQAEKQESTVTTSPVREVPPPPFQVMK